MPAISTEEIERQWVIIASKDCHTIQDYVSDAKLFIRKMPNLRFPTIEWIADYGQFVGYDCVIDTIAQYLDPAPSAQDIPPPPAPPRQSVGLTPTRPMTTTRDELLQAMLATHQSPEQIEAQATKAANGIVVVLGFIAQLVVSILAILAIYAIINAGVRFVAHKDITNEIRIFMAQRSDPEIVFDEDGKYLAWRNGEIVFYSHDYTCFPSFRAIDSQGQLVPPPLEWPKSDAETLLSSEYYGCAPTSKYQAWAGYWGKSPWGELVTSDTEWIKSWTTSHASDFPAGKDIRDVPMWVQYGKIYYATKKDELLAMNTPDLQKKGATGQTGSVTQDQSTQIPAMRPTMQPQPQQAPSGNDGQWQPAPAQANESGGQVNPDPPAPQPTPTDNPAEVGILPPVPTDMPAAPYIDPTQAPFATQTPEPIRQPSVTPITPVYATLVPLADVTRNPVMQQSRYTANNGESYSDACVALEDKYHDKTDDSPIPIPDFVALTHCKVGGQTN